MVSRLFNTARYLKPVQLYSLVCRRKPVHLHIARMPDLRTPNGIWTPGIIRETARIGPDRFRFLNQERSVKDWNDPSVPKLWLYNLHYFEAPDAELIRKWVNENPVGLGNGWEPYPLSLRISNWIKWALAGNLLDNVAVASLAIQARYLSRTVEHNLLANHLFANAKALIFAGCFFEARYWLQQGLDILRTEIDEQILRDGGHFERSTMYHSLILEDVLDLVNLGHVYSGLLPDWSQTAGSMLGWLSQMTHPDGRIAFFNDAAFGIAPEPATIVDYARRLGIKANQQVLSDSGYVRLESECAVALFDAAPIGPDYQPGHAHADTLSFELSLGGRRAIVNTGISTYEKCADRHAQRGTAAHNTVRIDCQDSSEVWSAFRVARRARPLSVITDHTTFVEASHDGYSRLKDPVIHMRRLTLASNELQVKDTIQAKREHQVEITFHVHPESNPQVELDPKLIGSEMQSHWYPEFNKSIPNRTITGRWQGTCPASFITRIPLFNGAPR